MKPSARILAMAVLIFSAWARAAGGAGGADASDASAADPVVITARAAIAK